MKVSEALKTRITCRAFLDKQVPEATVRQILEEAKYAPSGGNLQPWHAYAITGDRLKEFLAIIAEKQKANPFGDGDTEYDIYPKGLTDPYKARRFKCGEDMYATIGVPREDKEGRMKQFMRNFNFFDAPVAMFFAIDRQMGLGQWSDLGMFIQSLMLVAREHGLHTAPQEAWAIWHKTVSEFLGMPEELMLFCGLGLGYMDESAPINHLRTDRAPLEEFATLSGF
ncbi:nitroreductase [Parvibaculum sp.]|uniref:nitroreductase n=1 Tax=Parvibaculum sp. TaxID=2024848 RepID=UPI001B2171CD|nr:nitroreductase [Parvibaculum sp.]MBO6678656.1 nitroreductase [Parvibaculum sp.]MBO6684256.1 nitroreductase [Parvibaculum sp.]MBO6906315.1 nitroreductase [Parvibaculum sp.]